MHRDLKPANILLDAEEDSGRIYVRLIDFGIASSQGVLSGPLTDNGRTMGTADYMAPERLKGVAASSNDIYSLGVILHVMLTGALPRPDTTQNLPIPLLSVVDRCLETEPEDRFSSVDDLLLAFEHAYKSLTSSQKMRAASSASASAEVSRPALDDDSPETDSQTFKDISPQPSAHITGTHFALENRGAEPISRPPLRTNRPSSASLPTMRKAVSSDFSVIEPGSTVARRSETSEQKAVEAQATTAKDIVLPVRASSSSSSTQGTILPSIAQKGNKFKKKDYDAPTTELNPDFAPQRKSQLVVADVLSRPARATKQPKKRTKRRGSVVFVFFVLILAVLVAMVGVGYLILQLSTTAAVTISPRVQTVSGAFTFEAKPGVKSIDVVAGSLPASVLSNSQQGSTQGQPTGVSGCVLNIFECKETVSLADVSNLSTQLRPKLQTQISQNLHQQASAKGVTLVGDIVYSDGQITANPIVGTVATTMTVNMTEQGSVEYFKSADVQNLALQALKHKLATNYTLVSSTTKVGNPVVRSHDANGNITIAIAAAGVARYQVPATELQDIKNHIKGDSLKAARAVISTHTNLDQTVTAVRMSYGDTVPSNIRADLNLLFSIRRTCQLFHCPL